MITFVLGVIFAGIAEYLFYNKYVRPEEESEISTLKTEIELKDKQISSLQSQLASISEEDDKKS